MTPELKTSLIMPFYKDGNAIHNALKSLEAQTQMIDEVVIIDDFSPQQLDNNCFSSYYFRPRVIRHQQNRGLSETYNTGIKATSGDLIIFMHPDVILPTCYELERLLEPFNDPNVVVAAHVSCRVSDDYWKDLSLIEKSLIGASEKNSSGFNGQFDCIRRSALSKSGLFDPRRFRSAGEDGDLMIRLGRVGKIQLTTAKAEHRHVFWPRSSLGSVIRKSFEYGRAQGVLVWSGLLSSRIRSIQVFYRELLLSICLATGVATLSPLVFLGPVFVALPYPILILRRDRRLDHFLLLVVLQLGRDFAHFVGVVVGMLTRRQSSKVIRSVT